MNDFIIAIIMGIVEGLTEFAPVSSTGHLILTGHLLGFEGSTRATTFEVVIQLGSILAVVVVFWKRILSLMGMRRYRGRTQEHHNFPSFNVLHVLLGIMPFMVGGVVFHDFIKQKLFSPHTVVIGLVVGGILMIVAERLYSHTSDTTTLDSLTYRQALFVGLFQCLALWPGFSRSGSTISGGLLMGMNHKVASEFTFILAVPVMFAATAKDLYDSWAYLQASDIPLFVTGFITAFVVALFAITFFLKLISKIKLTPFAYYRFILAIVFWIFVL
ncbi:undecaprenyl-diphosphate phosphatase [Bacillus cereus]|uniref:Undecaprenyl-diphosphatase n=3 Tax=Bacillus cereus group TaxID=86661 RepID=A0A1C4DIM3_BACCE|nr:MULTISPECIES: undecaprenyl-diphosphate phosphatase [Bacillus]EOP98699.1 undecaprenyl-diphosphatase UppP [Bacillus cereus VD140]MBL3889396.1 undecaprenyl-diphosphate phosphatase [Bacillus cereus]MCC2368511.1 undecaprenyl-diphosphate phosphatase [Bacillus cereus]MCC2396592.1 undecaprenyl-diphosphate phosphatase [Bacillus cereus]MCC2451525.1 undecaprenyl-diphosphate phosphatase [Bacillus cereus]